MQNYIKLPLEEYIKIQSTLSKVLHSLSTEDDNYHEVLYAKNSLFECTHDFENGKPDLYNDDIK